MVDLPNIVRVDSDKIESQYFEKLVSVWSHCSPLSCSAWPPRMCNFAIGNSKCCHTNSGKRIISL